METVRKPDAEPAPRVTYRNLLTLTRRNSKCPCGSGSKFKVCCYQRSGPRPFVAIVREDRG